VHWPDDEPGLAALDTSYSTDRIYNVRHGALSFELVEEQIDPPLRRHACSPPLLTYAERLRAMEHVVVAEESDAIAGTAAASFTAWNRRVEVEHFYIGPRARRRGIGRALMDSVIAFARTMGAGCVWLETQNVNYPAVQFYRRIGFHLCGVDQRLYDPASPAGRDTALFFALDLAP
jgi:ribosomal protein S18 acetylase RimI-like enzyme